jgi:hypothetical protein
VKLHLHLAIAILALLCGCVTPYVPPPPGQPVGYARFTDGTGWNQSNRLQKAVIFKGPECDKPESVVPGEHIPVAAGVDFAFALSGSLLGWSCTVSATTRLEADQTIDFRFFFGGPFPCWLKVVNPISLNDDDDGGVKVVRGRHCSK